MIFLLSFLFSLNAFAHKAVKAPCRVDDTCQISGSSSGRAAHTYSLICTDKKSKRQVEYVEGGASAEEVDMISLRPMAKCSIDMALMTKRIKEYESQKHDIENPKCMLGHWKGQVTYQSNGVTGRCSFMMNKDLSEKFEKSTGVSPTYQCENDYFLSATDKKDGTAIYKKTKSGWELDCKAAMRTGPIESIDWKNPPQYYQPEGPTVAPKTKPAE